MQLLLIKILPTELEFTDQNGNASLGGYGPPTFRLTAERANRLRHRDGVRKNEKFKSFVSTQKTIF